jgi:ferritin-like metal-binding protein YciE
MMRQCFSDWIVHPRCFPGAHHGRERSERAVCRHVEDVYYAEKQIYKSLPKMAKAANSDQLRAAFEKHHDETEGQIERLEKIFELLGKPARGKKCDAIEGMKARKSWTSMPTHRRSMPACWRPPRLSSITRFPVTARCKRGPASSGTRMPSSFSEEKKTDDALSKLALSAVNAKAA